MSEVYSPLKDVEKATQYFVPPATYPVTFRVSDNPKLISEDEYGLLIKMQVTPKGCESFWDQIRVPTTQGQFQALSEKPRKDGTGTYKDGDFTKWCRIQKVMGWDPRDKEDVIDKLGECELSWPVILKGHITPDKAKVSWDEVVSYMEEHVVKPNGKPQGWREYETDKGKGLTWTVYKVDEKNQDHIVEFQRMGGRFNNILHPQGKPERV